MEIKILRLIIEGRCSLKPPDAEKIRGYFGNLFWDNPYAHHHKHSGGLIYQYPCVQYKVIKGSCVLIGFKEGIKIVKHAFHNLKEINLDGEWQEIFGKGLEINTAHFNITHSPITYTFLTPWLALNEENYKRYQRLGSEEKRRELLSKVLVGNILSIAKSLGYTVKDEIRAEIKRIREAPTSLKGVPMLGFWGEFAVNFEIPDYWGLGKSVSRGFGTIIKRDNRLTDNRPAAWGCDE